MARKSGPVFERKTAKDLSLWWSNNKRDDLFYRVGASGARATARAKRGKSTANQGGDIQATHPKALPFTSVFSVECKFGYQNQGSIHDLLDAGYTRGKHPLLYEQFILQAIDAMICSRSQSWMLITKRQNRDAMVTLPLNVWNKIMEIEVEGLEFDYFGTLRWSTIDCTICRISKKLKVYTRELLANLRLEDFFK